ncbi:MAG TPA: MFS transporter [Chloroflexota bacterium]|nr:MFS transporter [Chloroflexota bacterium]
MSTAARPTRPAAPSRTGIAAFQHRDFTLYWIGQLASNVGSWMQVVATGWLVLILTNSAADLGINATLQGLPILFCAFAGGVLADRLDRYWTVVGVQMVNIVPDGILAILVATGKITVNELYAYAFINGLINGLANPARQAIVPNLVPKEALMSALALNGILWQGAAVLGPSLAGIALAVWGTPANFYINVVSDVISIAVMLPMRSRPPRIEHTTSAWQNMVEGLHYSWRSDTVRVLLMMVAAISLLGRSYFALMPVFARDVFDAGPQGLGFLITMPAVGTIIAGFGISALKRGLALQRWFYVSGIAMSVTILGFSFSPWFGLSLGILVFIGLAQTSAATFSQTLIQQTVEEGFRGRVMSLYMACTIAAWRMAAMPFGFLAERFGAREAVAGGAVVLLLVLVPASRRKTSAEC